MQTNSRAYASIAGLATILALIVIMLGAYTRLSDAGLGCPDWPGCYGHLTVPQTQPEITQAAQAYQQTVEPAKAWKEMVHRYFAGSLGILILVLTVWAFARKRHEARQPTITPVLLLLLVIFQAVLGMWTVTWLVLPLIVTAHLLGGMLIAALLWYLTLASRKPQPTIPRRATKFRFWAVLGLIILFIQLFLGAWTSTNYAAIICPTFPYCQGSLFPPMNFHQAFDIYHPIGINYEGGILGATARVTIQMVHRYGAFITAAYLGLLALIIICSSDGRGVRRIATFLLFALVLQFALGVANVLWLLPMHIAVAHNGVAAILLLTVVTLVYKLYRKPTQKLHIL
jgi:cytochrome c oxidase assembly protein subunit 15